jgi:PKD repeat protein
MRMKSIPMLCVIVLMLTLTTTGVSTASAPTRFYVDPPEIVNPALGIGDSFSVDLNVENVTELYGWNCNLTFRPDVLQVWVETLAFSTWMQTESGGAVYPLITVDNTAGFVFLGQIVSPFPPPPHGATGDGTLVTVTFNVTSVGASYLDLTDSKLNTYISGNNVPIPHTAEDGFFDNRTGNAQPVASFSVDPLVANVSDTKEFNASASYDPDGWLVSYHWDYGDGTSEIYVGNPSGGGNWTAETAHVYSHAGNFTVTLTVTDNDDATDTETANVTVVGHDVAVITVTSSHVTVMKGVQVTVNVTVTNLGSYTETFNVTAYYNETAIETQEVANMPSQTEEICTFLWDTAGADFGEYVLKANATTVEEECDTKNNEYIDGIVTIASTNIVDYTIVIGGFTFHVIVESNSTSSNFKFNQTEKTISFNVEGQTNTTGFCNITIPADFLGGPYTTLFDYLPVSPPTQEITNGTHTFIYFTYNHSAHTIKIIGQTVATPPIAIFTCSTTYIIANTPVTFNATDSNDPDGTIESYQWDFGDSNLTIVTEPILKHAYKAADIYTVTLTITDNKQLTNFTQTQITVIDYPRTDFSYSPTTPLVYENVTFDASASEPNGGSIMSYQWDFGDDTADNGETVTHAYSEVGNYEVVLNTTDSEGLWNTKTKTVNVYIHNIAVTDLTSPNTIKIGQQISLNITVVNKGNFTETLNVTVCYDDTSIETQSVTNLVPGASETITAVWNTTGVNPGTYTIKAIADTVFGENETDDNIFMSDTVVIQKLDSQLSISVSPSTTTVGSTVTINGTITPILQGVNITISHRLVGEQTWNALTTTTTNEKGAYTHNWNPENAGTYEIKANWQGDTNTLSSESTTQTIKVQELESTPLFFYVAGALVISAIIAMLFYFLKIRKAKQ